MDDVTVESRMLGGLWGILVGDALGVPVEFLSRDDVRKNAVTAMRGYGTHNQPPGTWSDDSSMTLCTIDSLMRGFDTTDMASRFLQWFAKGLWTPHGEPFDIGVTTSDALCLFEHGTPAEEAGGDGELNNGNGSLMRMLPVVLQFRASDRPTMIDRIHRVSAITHRHPRSLMACGYYGLIVSHMLNGKPVGQALESATPEFEAAYCAEAFDEQKAHFAELVSGRIASMGEDEIRGSGYVVNTLKASVWCLMKSDSFSEATLRAVNLGEDTDTTGAVAGSLAGIQFGERGIPSEWIKALARCEDLAGLLEKFVGGLGDFHQS